MSRFSSAKSFTLLLLGIILLSILNLPPILCVREEPFTKCGALFNCGKFTGIGFPFWGGNRAKECGYSGLKLDCENGTTIIQINKLKYRVLDLNLKIQLLKITRNDLSQSLCPQELANTTLDSGLFEYASAYVNLTLLYGCPAVDFPVPYEFDCAVKGIQEKNGYVVFGSQILGICHLSVVVPVSYTSFFNFKVEQMIAEGFEVRFKLEGGGCSECESSGGRCGYDDAGKKFVCFCSDQSAAESKTCPAGAVANGSRAPTVADAGYGPRASTMAPSAASGTLALFCYLSTNCLSKLLSDKI